MTRKKFYDVVCVIIVSLILAACSINVHTDSDNNSVDKKYNNEEKTDEEMKSSAEIYEDRETSIEVKGIFYFEPDSSINMEEDELNAMERYMLITFDMNNTGRKNIKIGNSNDDVKLIINTNTYCSEYSLPWDSVMNSFIDNCGYYSLSGKKLDILYGGQKDIRNVWVYKINKNDIENFQSGSIAFDMVSPFDDENKKDELKYDYDFQENEIRKIGFPDDIFSVEDNPDDYQIARSLLPRTKKTQEQMLVIEKYSDFDEATATMGFMYFEEEKPLWGVSCSTSKSLIVSDKLPKYNHEAIERIYPELAYAEEDYREALKELLDRMLLYKQTGEYDKERIDLLAEKINNSYEKIVEWFEKN